MKVELLNSLSDIRAACEVLRELRPQYSQEQLISTVQLQMENGYQLAACFGNSICLGVMGFVTGRKLAWGHHIYIDDLVVTEKSRSRGAGKALLDWVFKYARENELEQIHLDSGVQRYAAHKFYLNNGFRIASHHFSIETLPE